MIGLVQGLVMQSLLAGDVNGMRAAAPSPFTLYRQGLAAFLAVSVPARLGRFVLVTLLAHLALRGLRRRWPGLPPGGLLAGAWLAFYLVYFSVMPG